MLKKCIEKKCEKVAIKFRLTDKQNFELHERQTEIGLMPSSHIVSKINLRLSDMTVVKPEKEKHKLTFLEVNKSIYS